MTVEQALDYDAVTAMLRNDGYNTDEALEKFRQAGITSFTIYDTTLNKLAQRGDIALITRLEATFFYPQLQSLDLSYDYYMIGKPKNEPDDYFDEVQEGLASRIGRENAAVVDDPQYRILGIRGMMPNLGDMNVGIMTADANRIAGQGFRVILRPTNYSDVTLEQIDQFFRRAGAVKNVSGIMFVGKEVLGYKPDEAQRRLTMAAVAEEMKKRGWALYMIEAANQLQYDRQEGLYELVDLLDYRAVRSYAMSKEELTKITPDEAVMRYYISDLERNVRVNLYPLYPNPLHGMDLTETNLDYISKTSQKLRDRGYSLDAASVMERYYPNAVLAAIVAIAAICGFVFTLNLFVPLSERMNYMLAAAAVLVGAGGTICVSGPLFLQVMAVGCAVTAPTAAMLILLDHWKAKPIDAPLGYGKVLRDGAAGLVCVATVAMIGGLFIAAMLGNIRFFMEFDFYRGVKLTFLLPLILVAVGYLMRFPLWGKILSSPADFLSFTKYFFNIPIKMGTLMVVGIVAVIAVIFVGRSGHTAGVPVPDFEIALRRFLENAMYARPREKEFFIGHPAFFLMVAALYRKWPQILHFFLVIAATIGIGSMVETFAHIRTPFLMSFVRGIDGLILGMIIGVSCIFGLAVLQYITAWLGKQVNRCE